MIGSVFRFFSFFLLCECSAGHDDAVQCFRRVPGRGIDWTMTVRAPALSGWMNCDCVLNTWSYTSHVFQQVLPLDEFSTALFTCVRRGRVSMKALDMTFEFIRGMEHS